jgi:hypothetical protein
MLRWLIKVTEMDIKVISHSGFPMRLVNRITIEVDILNNIKNIAMTEMAIEKDTRIVVTSTTVAMMAINTKAIIIMLTGTAIDTAIEDIHIVTMW